MELTEYESESLLKLAKSIEAGKWSNEGIVQIIELCGQYLNWATVPHYAKRHGLSYNGVKKNRDVRTILGVRMVIDNA